MTEISFWRLESEIKVPAWSREGLLLSCRVLTEFSHGAKGHESSQTLLPIMTAPPSRPDHLPKAAPHNTNPFGFRISTYEPVGGRKQSDPSSYLPLMLTIVVFHYGDELHFFSK